MLIGVICEVVSAVAATEKEALTLGFVREKLGMLMGEAGVDDNDDGTISKAEFLKLFTNPKAVAILQEVGVDVIGLCDFTDTIFEMELKSGEDGEFEEKEKTLTFSDFMNLVLDMRGANVSTVKDMALLRKYLDQRLSRLSGFQQHLVNTPKRRRTKQECDSFLGDLGEIERHPSVGLVKYHSEPCVSPKTPGHYLFKDSVSTGASSFKDAITAAVQDLLSAHDREVATLQADKQVLSEELSSFTTTCGGRCPCLPEELCDMDILLKPGDSKNLSPLQQQRLSPGHLIVHPHVVIPGATASPAKQPLPTHYQKGRSQSAEPVFPRHAWSGGASTDR